MAKKRKAAPKSDQTPASSQLQKQLKLDQSNPEDQQQQQPQPQLTSEQQAQQQQLHEEAEQEQQQVEVEEEEVEEEVEEEEDEEDDEDDEEEEEDDDEDDDEPIQKLLEPFTKDQLITLLSKAATSHPDVASSVKSLANQDPVHRKIFVHGLGWDTTADTLRASFSEYGQIEDCKAVTDKLSGKSKGYGFILFKTRAGARRALKNPQKKIGNRMTACQLAAVGPVPASTSTGQMVTQHAPSELTQRKIYVSNVSAELDPQKLTAFFAKFGEIEEGPLGLDKLTGKFKGFCLFVYRSVESARKALEEPHKNYEGHVLHCQRAIDGPKLGRQGNNQQRGQHYGGRNDNSNPNLVGAGPASGAGMMGQSVGYNQGGVGAAAAAQGLNPALGQALTALLASQGAGLGLNNLLGTLGGGVVAPGVGASHGIQGGYGNQAVPGVGMNPGGLSGYGTQGGLQSAYPNQQTGQGGTGRSQYGHLGGVQPYSGH